MKTCTMPGCTNKHRARGLCATHYNQQHQPNRHAKVIVSCDTCGEQCERFPTRSVTKRFCSFECRDEWARAELKGPYNPNRKPRATKPRAPRPQAPRRQPTLAAAARAKDYPTLLALIEQMSAHDEAGCWVWPRLGSDGYPRGAKGRALHRLSLKASLGTPLGDQPVHHRCANRACVRPDHLQLVTHYDNIAEMLARNYMVRRIRDLEDALRLVAPAHDLLSEVGLPAAS